MVINNFKGEVIMFDSIFFSGLKGYIFGAIVTLLIINCIKGIGNSKTVTEGADRFDRSLSGFTKNPILDNPTGKYGTVLVNENDLYFEIAYKAKNLLKFTIPYNRVLRCETSSEFIPPKEKPDFETIPDEFTVEFIMDDGTQHTLTFDMRTEKKMNLTKFYPNNIIDTINQRMKAAQENNDQTI